MTKEQLKQALNVCSEHEACENCPAHEYCDDLSVLTGEALNAIETLETDKNTLAKTLKEAEEIIDVVTIPSAIVCEIESILKRLHERLASVSDAAIEKALTVIFEKYMGDADK